MWIISLFMLAFVSAFIAMAITSIIVENVTRENQARVDAGLPPYQPLKYAIPIAALALAFIVSPEIATGLMIVIPPFSASERSAFKAHIQACSRKPVGASALLANASIRTRFDVLTRTLEIAKAANGLDHVHWNLRSRSIFAEFIVSYSGIEWERALERKIRDFAERGCSRLDLLEHAMRAPGLGVAKGAFTLQLKGLPFMCIDSVNAKSLGLKAPTTAKKYIKYCDALDLEPWQLWGYWCRTVGERDAWSPGNPAEALSRAHVKAIADAETLLRSERNKQPESALTVET